MAQVNSSGAGGPYRGWFRRIEADSTAELYRGDVWLPVRESVSLDPADAAEFERVMLERYGMKAVISDPLDTNLTAVAKGQRQDIVDIVHQAMDGTAPDPSSIDKELGDYIKTVKVIMGESLFSDSYLEI